MSDTCESSEYVVVIGSATVDVIGRAGQPLKPKDFTPGRIHSSPGGVARNVAENLARLSIQTELISAIGDDAAGRRIMKLGEQTRIGMSHSFVIPGAQTPSYIAVAGLDGDTALAVSDMEALTFLDAKYSLIQSAAIVVADTNLPPSTLEFLAGGHEGHTLYADPVSSAKAAKIRPILNSLNTIKLNRLEAEVLTGIEVFDLNTAVIAANKLTESGVNNVF